MMTYSFYNRVYAFTWHVLVCQIIPVCFVKNVQTVKCNFPVRPALKQKLKEAQTGSDACTRVQLQASLIAEGKFCRRLLPNTDGLLRVVIIRRIATRLGPDVCVAYRLIYVFNNIMCILKKRTRLRQSTSNQQGNTKEDEHERRVPRENEHILFLAQQIRYLDN